MSNRPNNIYRDPNSNTKWIVIAVIIALVGGLITFRTWENAKQREYREVAQKEKWPEQETRLRESIKKFDEIAAQRPIALADIELLENAKMIYQEFQSEYPRVFFPGSAEILHDIKDRRKLYLSKLWHEESNSKEEQANHLIESISESDGISSEAIVFLRSALSFQDQINNEFPESEYVDYPRSARLKGWIQSQEVKPAYEKFLIEKKNASALIAEEKWNEAILSLKSAIEIQTKINRDFPNSPHMDESEILRLKDEILTAEAHILFIESENLLASAEPFIEIGNELTAADRMSEALEIQNRINLEFSQTPVASVERAEQIAAKIHEIRAKELIAKIETLESELDLLLVVGMFEKIEYKLIDLQTAFQSLLNDFPHYPSPPTHIEQKVQYLKNNLHSLNEIVKACEGLETDKIELQEDDMWLSPLISQSLYQLVMNENPSRNKSKDRPVDSVSFEDVSLFVHRLNLIFEADFSLPDSQKLVEHINDLYSNSSSEIQEEWARASQQLPHGKAIVFNPDANEILTERDVVYRSRRISFRVMVHEQNQ